MYVTTGQTLTMILRIFFCTLGWSIKLAKNWDTEKSNYLKSLSVEYRFKPLLRDTRLIRLTSFNAPEISEMKRSTFHFSTFCTFFKNGDKQKQIQRCKQLWKRKDVMCNRIKYGRSKLILLESIKTNTVCTTHREHNIYISDYLRMEIFLYKKTDWLNWKLREKLQTNL